MRPLLIACVLACAFMASAQQGIVHSAERKQITLSDIQHNLVLRLNYDSGCVLDQVTVLGREVVSPNAGVCSSVKVGNEVFSTRSGIPTPKVTIGQDSVTVENILFGGAGVQFNETWHFTVKADRILWRIDRDCLSGGVVEDMSFPGWNFNDMSTWTGGILGNGGVIWNKYLETTNATFGTRADSVTFWNRGSRECLRIASTPPKNRDFAAKFSHQPNNAFSFSFVASEKELAPKHFLRRFLHDRQDLWKPFPVKSGVTSVELTLQALQYDMEYDLGTLRGLNETSVREVFNTIARYGVIDRGLVGGNGWRTGWVCLHEQWFAQFGWALGDPAYTKTFAEALDYERDNAIEPDGRVKSRWHHIDNDAMPRTYDALGFYEAQWGMLVDSQPCYVINVAEQFDLTGDKKWLRGQKAACESALEYLLRRDSDSDGLVEVLTNYTSQKKASDWIDVMWASYESALINAEMYCALELWADAEDILGDHRRAASYRQSAARIKAAYNRTTAEGGFWDPQNQWYVYWRDKDDSIHGNNLVTPVNFTAIGYGLCDDPVRQKAILDRMEVEMQKENLFFWPLNFFTYERGEGRDDHNFPYPSYENGDIFLPWGELGIRSYARNNPDLAIKYIKKVLERYEKDGLSFQRYLRESQKGAGHDILAGNCSAVVGLYRNIYGIQPRHNRLYLEPRLTPELNGTQVRYRLRDQEYRIDLTTNDYSISTTNFAVRAHTPFAVNATPKRIEFFPGKTAVSQLTVAPSGLSAPFQIHIESWSADGKEPRRWTETSPSPAKVRHTISGLQPGASYQLTTLTAAPRSFRANKSGHIEFFAAPQSYELRASPLQASF